MTIGLGANAVVKLDNGSGVLTSIISYINSGEFARMCDALETTVLGLNDRTFIPGLKSSSFSLQGFFDPALDQILHDAFASATTRTLEVSPQGTGTGAIKYTVEVFCTNYPIPFDTENPVAISADFQCTGAVTRGTH